MMSPLTIRWRLLIVLAALLLPACAGTPVPHGALILDDVNIVDVETGEIRRHQAVILDAGRIHSIVPSGDARWPADARRLDLDGRYLVPALYDAHVHVFDERDLQLYALMGIQAVRNLDGWPWHLELRDTDVSAETWTARLVTSGAQFQRPMVQTPADMQAALAANRAAGYDWVKLYDGIDEPLLDEIAEVHGDLRITGHLPDDVALTHVLDAGVYDDIAHAEELLAAMKAGDADWRASIDDVAARLNATSTTLTTTLVSNRMIADQAADFAANIARPEVAFAPPLLQMFWASDFNPNKHLDDESATRLAGMVEDLEELVGALAERGVVIVAGTDSPNPTTVPAFSLHQELSLLVESGLDPLDAIRAATLNAAVLIDGDATAVHIVEGAPANFIVTRANPLDDVTALRSFDAVVNDGRYKTREQIDAELDALRASYASDLEYLKSFTPQGPQPILDAVAASTGPAPISEPGLRSLVWIYMKFGNLDAAAEVAEALQAMYPSEASTANVAWIDSLRAMPPMHEHEMDHQMD